MRLRRSDWTTEGIARRRRGRGFSYHWSDGTPVTDEQQLTRIRGLAVPPAWTDVWICPWPQGHIQAVGFDAKGRRQYRYHDEWRVRRDLEKFDRSVAFGARLPDLRRPVERELGTSGSGQDRVLAAALRLLDVASMRIGGKEYARDNESYGMTTLRREHLQIRGSRLRFCFVGKGGQEQRVEVEDEAVADVLQGLRRRRGHTDGLFAWRDGRKWIDMSAADVNERIKSLVGDPFTAKFFRTWNATVRVAVALDNAEVPTSQRHRAWIIKAALADAAAHLGNTPAVCRSSYLDPRVIEAFDHGERLALGAGAARRRQELAVLDLLDPAGTLAAA